MRQASWRRLRAFAQDAKGNVALLFGFALIPLLIGIGVAVDYGRALIIHDRMGAAVDAAALAIGSWPNQSQADLKTKAQQFFDANYPPSKLGTVGAIDVQFPGDDIVINVKGTMQTTFMRLANIDSLDVGASTTVHKKERNIELVLVLDTTGSMSQTLGTSTKLSALKSAAKQLVSTLFDGQATSTTVKIGVVPFAAAVNVGPGRLTSNPEWFDLNPYTSANASADPIAFEDLDKNTNNGGISTIKLYSGNSYSSTSTSLKNRSWAGCVRERSANATYELTDAPPSSDPASRWVPYFAPDEPDRVSGTTGTSYSNNYLSDGSYGTACVKNDTTSPTDTRRECFTGKYKNVSVSGTTIGPDSNCPPAAITPMTNVASTINTAIDALAAKGSTVIPTGLLWGWRVISPTSPFTEGVDYSNDKYTKAIVLLTGGNNDVGGGDSSTGVNKSYYNAFGYARNGHLGSTSGSTAESTLNTKTLTVCNAVKGLGVRLYTIGLGVTTASQTLLQNCASTDDQGNKLFYNSPTSDQLASIFQDIAQGLSELRIAQ